MRSLITRHPEKPNREPGESRERRDGTAHTRALEAARRARRTLMLLVPLTGAVVVLYAFRRQWLGQDTPVRVAAAVVLILLGWPLAGSLARMLMPRLTRSLNAASAESAAFMVRLLLLGVIVLVSLKLSGVSPAGLIAGASVTAIVLGLAAQQTFGNLFAGVVLLSARPFEVGDRVRFNGFGMDVEGTVASRGLLYVRMRDGEDAVYIPNSTALTMSVRPVREPAGVDMRARLAADVDPEAVQRRVTGAISVPTRGDPVVDLEEFSGDDVVVRIRARPIDRTQGSTLAREVLRAVARFAPEDAA